MKSWQKKLGLQSQPIEAVEGREFEVYEGVTTSSRQKDLLNLNEPDVGVIFLDFLWMIGSYRWRRPRGPLLRALAVEGKGDDSARIQLVSVCMLTKLLSHAKVHRPAQIS